MEFSNPDGLVHPKAGRGTPAVSKYQSIGRTFNPIAFLPPPVPHGPLRWRWFPWRIKFSVTFVLSLAAAASIIGGIVLIVALYILKDGYYDGKNVGALVGGIFLMLLSIIFLYIIYIVHWNHKLREVMCYVKGKQHQALELWKHAGQGNEVYAKDEFYSEKLRGVHFRVLRDGTTEAKRLDDAESMTKSSSVAEKGIGVGLKVAESAMIV